VHIGKRTKILISLDFIRYFQFTRLNVRLGL
jgi:hypothetical protein